MSSPEYYDNIFSKAPHYQGPPEDSPYYPLWKGILKLLKDKHRILDVGCGPGQFAELCIAAGHEYIGLDWSSKAIELARARNLDAEFHQLDVEENPVKLFNTFYDSYDLCTFIEFFEHIKRDREVLDAVPHNKQVILSVPSYDASGHFRHFRSLDHASQRYSPFINMANRLIFSLLGERAAIFVLKGRRSRARLCYV